MGTNRFCANLNCVAKPSIDHLEYTKADKMINRSLGIIGNRNRICIDMRSLNDILGEVPIVKLPKTDQLKGCAYKSYLSSFDLTQFFYGIKLAQESKQYCNFYYDGAVYTHSCLPMGLKSSPFWAQSVSERIFSDENLIKYCEQKGITMASKEFPFTKVSQF